MKILFLLPYPLREAPSQRFRFEQYVERLRRQGFTVRTQSFLTTHSWQLFFERGNPIQKALTLMRGFLKRVYVLAITPSFYFVFIHREATPLGPPVIEWFIAKILRKKIIYDFDDAIWLTDRKDESAVLRSLKWRQKVKAICQWSYKVSAGNEYLCAYARQFNKNVVLNPTTIDTEKTHNRSLYNPPLPRERGPGGEALTIGWTGSHSTLKYLEELQPVLKQVEEKYANVTFLVIADQPPPMQLQRLSFIKWHAQTEIEDLMKMDIGIMPLPDDEWAKGKCGFKALQYMALEIPAVVSPVGVNTEIIANGEEGFLCASGSEWFDALKKLIDNKNLRMELGKNGRRKVLEHYSVSSNTSTFLSLFE